MDFSFKYNHREEKMYDSQSYTKKKSPKQKEKKRK